MTDEKIKILKPAKIYGPVASYETQATELKQQIENQLKSANFPTDMLKSVWDNQVQSNLFCIGKIKAAAIKDGANTTDKGQLRALVDITQKMINYALLKVKADFHAQI